MPKSLALAAVVGVAFQAVITVAPAGVVAPVVYALLALMAGAASVGHVWQARERRGRLRLGWSVAVAASGMWSLANLLWFLDPSSRPDSGVLSPASYLATASGVLAPTALLLCSPAEGRLASRLRRMIDGATIAAALALLGWQLVLRQIFPGIHADTRAAVIAVLAGELVAGAYAVVVIARARPSEGNSIALWASALGTLSLFTVLDAANAALGDDRFSNGVGGGYLAATLLLVACCRTPLPSVSGRAEGEQPGPLRALPYLPIGLAFTTAAHQQIAEGRVDALSFWVLLSMAVLVFLRQFLQLRTIEMLIEKVEAQRRDLAHQATHDPLTGLGNRTALAERATALFDGETTRHVGVLMLDLDGFKPINDTHGHSAGDKVLRAVADRLRAQLRLDDLAVRLGGDEFVILLADVRDQAHAAEIGERILRSLRAPLDLGPAAVPVLASAGLAVGATSDTSFEDLLHRADASLYTAKDSGKNVLRMAELYRAGHDGVGLAGR
ncbi:GGDEF domain-containing protein [Paractinoplanes durhamensis]|uniref:GGDEF domain-containing protein n=1 Tax=Paractinoplanes durhamensis TaxID=113563 RepID=UPI001944E213|nr:GGDEF domain-containing protein [Actinoplanes durhamensis]